jgi:hypothetical protein
VTARRARPQAAGFDTNVFVNCPFDSAYYPMLRPLLFTVVALGFTPRIATESSDSAESRIDKICGLIRVSRLSIHDLSRLKPGPKQFARMNMPFELGIDYGSRRFGDAALQTKRCLILGSAQYDYQKALSDLSGVDIKSHQDRPDAIARAVRDWFFETVNVRPAPSANELWYAFNDFTSAVYDARAHEGFTDEDLDMMPPPEYIDFIRRWREDRVGSRASRRRAVKHESVRSRR